MDQTKQANVFKALVVLLLAVIAVSYVVDVFTPKIMMANLERDQLRMVRMWDNGQMDIYTTAGGWRPFSNHIGEPIPLTK